MVPMIAGAAMQFAGMGMGMANAFKRSKPRPVMNSLLDVGRSGNYANQENIPQSLALQQAYGGAAGAINAGQYQNALFGGGPQSYTYAYQDPFSKEWSEKTINTGAQMGALPLYAQSLRGMTQANIGALKRSTPGVWQGFQQMMENPFELNPALKRQIMQENMARNNVGMTDWGAQPADQAIALMALGREGEQRFLRNAQAFSDWTRPAYAGAQQGALGLMGGYMQQATKTGPDATWNPWQFMGLGEQYAQNSYDSELQRQRAIADAAGGMMSMGGSLMGGGLGGGGGGGGAPSAMSFRGMENPWTNTSYTGY